jgi:hypothetical protein
MLRAVAGPLRTSAAAPRGMPAGETRLRSAVECPLSRGCQPESAPSHARSAPRRTKVDNSNYLVGIPVQLLG